VPDVSNNADDFIPLLSELEPFADSALIRPDEMCEPVIDDADKRTSHGVRFLEKSALDQRNTKRAKVIRCGRPPIIAAVTGRFIDALKLKPTYLSLPGKWKPIDDSHRDNARNCGNAVENVLQIITEFRI